MSARLAQATAHRLSRVAHRDCHAIPSSPAGRPLRADGRQATTIFMEIDTHLGVFFIQLLKKKYNYDKIIHRFTG